MGTQTICLLQDRGKPLPSDLKSDNFSQEVNIQHHKATAQQVRSWSIGEVIYLKSIRSYIIVAKHICIAPIQTR